MDERTRKMLTEIAKEVDRIVAPLCVFSGVSRSDAIASVCAVAMHSTMNAVGAAWSVRDFYAEHGRLPTKEDV